MNLPSGRENAEAWYYIQNERIIVGYKTENRIPVQIGSIGEDGFHSGLQLAPPFKYALIPRDNSYTFFQTGNKFCYLDVLHRQLKLVYDGATSTLQGVGGLYHLDQAPDAYVSVALEQQLLVLDNRGKTVATLPEMHRFKRPERLDLPPLPISLAAARPRWN